MNFDIFLDACRNIYGKSSSTFWGIFIKIPKLIPRVATVLYHLSITIIEKNRQKEVNYIEKGGTVF